MSLLVALLLGLAPAEVAGRWTIALPGERLSGLCLSPDGTTAAVRVARPAPEADAVAQYDLTTRRAGGRWSVGAGRLGDPFWLAGGRLAVVAADGLWLRAGDGEPAHWPMRCLRLAGAAARDRPLVAVTGTHGVPIIDLRDGRPARALAVAGEVTALLLDPTGVDCLTAEAEAGAHRLTRWRVDTGARLAWAGSRPVEALRLLGGDAGLLVLGGGELALRRWDDLALLWRRPVEAGSLAVSPDRRELLLGGAGGLWWQRLGDGEARRLADGPVDGVAWLGEGRALVASGLDLVEYRWAGVPSVRDDD